MRERYQGDPRAVVEFLLNSKSIAYMGDLAPQGLIKIT